MRSASFDVLIVIALCLFAAGCATPKKTSSHSASADTNSFWSPQLLYLLPAPHSRLYVGVDAVKGCEPSDAKLAKLREFLTTHCNKPDGIEIVRNDVIPVADARGRSYRELARKYLTGPPEHAGEPAPAFIYLLYYDGAVSDRRTANVPPHPKERTLNPQTQLLPYPAFTYVNARYGTGNSLKELILTHEAGHLLGLAGTRTNAVDNHCLNEKCVMRRALQVSLPRQLLGLNPVLQKQLCEQCEAHLKEASAHSPTNLRFVGPVLVRSEDGYDVLTLPNHVNLIIGGLTAQDCRDYAAKVRDIEWDPKEDLDRWRNDGWIKDEMLTNRLKLDEILRRAKTDHFDAVREMASLLEEKLRSK